MRLVPVLRGLVTGLTTVALTIASAQIGPADEGDEGLTSADRAAISRTLNAASAEAVAAVGCPPNDNTTVLVSAKRCIAEQVRRSRGRLLPGCFNSAKAATQGALYGRTECHNGAGVQDEAIAQARYVQRLNDGGVYGKPATVGGISPDIQWEVGYPKVTGVSLAGRPDVVVYDRAVPTAPIEIVEVKTAVSPGPKGAARQVTQYIRDFPRGSNSRPVKAKNLAGYKDQFRVLVKDCSDPGVSREVIDTYDVYPGSAGVLLFAVTDQKVRDCDDNEDDDGQQGEIEQPEGIPEQIPQFCADGCTLPAPGRDADNDGKDDFWEEFLEGHPELNDLPAWPELPATPVPDEATVDFTAGAVAALAVVALGVIVFCTATAGGCAAFLGAAVVGSEAGIISVGLAGAIGAALAAIGLGAWAVWGDPHIATLDGRAYDLMSVGEFELLHVPELDLDVQARFGPLGQSASVLERVAFEIDDQHVEIDGGVLVDGEKVTLASDGGAMLLGNSAGLVRDGSTYSLIVAGESEGLVIQLAHRNLRVFASDGLETTGLLGNNNDDPTDDLAYSDGTPAGNALSPEALHGPFADSWRVTDESTLFTYGPDESPESMTDPDFPATYLDLADFSDSMIASATQTCSEAGVLAGLPFDGCLLDVILTADESFAADSALVTTVPYDPSQRTFENGSLAEDFEGTVSSSFDARSYMTLNSTTIAGPLFDTPGYSMHASDVPRHDHVRTAFDLYIMGPVTTDGDKQRLDLEVDGELSTQIELDGGAPTTSDGYWTFTPLTQGEADDGVTYTSYRASADLPHATSSLTLELKPVGFRGVQGTALGVDNIELNLDTSEPTAVSAELPVNVASGSSGGHLASAGDAVHYRFAVGAGDRLTFFPRGCGASTNFQLVDVATGEVHFAQSFCGSATTTDPLTAGEYELRVSAWQPYRNSRPGDYGFELFSVPNPQSFAYTPGEVVADGVPATGAGNLETISSVDRYTFTLDAETALHYERIRGYLSYRIVDTSTDDVVADGYTDDDFTLPAGSYSLEFGNQYDKGTYSFNLFPVPPPDTFTYTLGTTVVNGQPAAGAGNLETSASVDRYEFTLTTETTLQYEQEVFQLFDYRVVDAVTGEIVGTGDWDRQFTLPAGDYALEIGYGNDQGTYSFTLFEVPPAETFAYTIGDTVSNGVPETGAGNLETIASIDRFTFTLTEPMKVQYDRTAGYADFRLISLNSGNVVVEGYKDKQFTLPPDEYGLEITGYAGTHGFRLFEPPAPQEFTYDLGDVVSNGKPAPGAGNLETVASIDSYAFTVTTSDTYQVDVPFMADYVITDAHSGVVVLETFLDEQVELAAGDYVIQFGPGTIETYTFQIFAVPEPQTFAYTLGSTVSNGVPAAGAGTLENIASIDRYTFTLDTETNVQYEYLTISSAPTYVIRNSATGQIAHRGGSKQKFTLSAGAYVIEFGDGEKRTYSFRLFEVPPPQEFAYTLGSTVSNGVPADGAGNLETIASVDRYTFTLTAQRCSHQRDRRVPR